MVSCRVDCMLYRADQRPTGLTQPRQTTLPLLRPLPPRRTMDQRDSKRPLLLCTKRGCSVSARWPAGSAAPVAGTQPSSAMSCKGGGPRGGEQRDVRGWAACPGSQCLLCQACRCTKPVHAGNCTALCSAAAHCTPPILHCHPPRAAAPGSRCRRPGRRCLAGRRKPGTAATGGR